MNAVMTAVTLWVVPPSRNVKIRVQRTSKRIPERPETKKRRSTQGCAGGAGAAMWVTEDATGATPIARLVGGGAARE